MTIQNLRWIHDLFQDISSGNHDAARRWIADNLPGHLEQIIASFEHAREPLEAFHTGAIEGQPGALDVWTGEAIDIIGVHNEFVLVTDRGLAHLAALPHVTDNAFVLSTDGASVWLSRRAHNKRAFPGHLTIAGGHRASMETGECAIRKELAEEYGIATLNGDLVEVCRHRWEVSGDPNVEERVLWLYRLTRDEEQTLQQFASELAQQKTRGDKTAFEAWLESQQSPGSGLGEVWGLYPTPIEEVFRAQGVIRTEDVFATGAVVEDVPVTVDLLGDILSTRWIVAALQRRIEQLGVL